MKLKLSWVHSRSALFEMKFGTDDGIDAIIDRFLTETASLKVLDVKISFIGGDLGDSDAPYNPRIFHQTVQGFLKALEAKGHTVSKKELVTDVSPRGPDDGFSVTCPINIIFQQKPTLYTEELSDIAQQVFEAHYLKPFDGRPKADLYSGSLERSIHGCMHASRTAMYVRPIINLYRAIDDESIKALTDEQIRLIEIAALFHDSGREGDEEDKPEWEKKSAKNCYDFLVKNGVDDPIAFQVSNGILKSALRVADSILSQVTFKLVNNADRLEIVRIRGFRPIFEDNTKVLTDTSATGSYVRDEHGSICVSSTHNQFIDVGRMPLCKAIKESGNTAVLGMLYKLISEARLLCVSMLDHFFASTIVDSGKAIDGGQFAERAFHTGLKISFEHDPSCFEKVLGHVFRSQSIFPTIMALLDVKSPEAGNAVGAFHHHHSLATTKAAEASESGAGAGSA